MISSWKQILRQNFTSPEKLADFLELSSDQREHLLMKPRFILNLPYRLAAKVSKRTLDDPILRQFLPMNEETMSSSCFVSDPVGDTLSRRSDRLLNKYEGRVLLIATSACAMHCRYCFRQHFDYPEGNRSFTSELAYLAKDSSISEVILSGGDPLSLGNDELKDLLENLSKIPHLKRLRIHTRFPIGIPERIDEGFLSILENCPLQTWMVIHSNHPRELDEEVLLALKRVQKLGIPVLNQAVLLRDVNDSVEILKELSERLVDGGITPYYLHQLDRVQGAQHFEVPESEGMLLIAELAKVVSGYALPRYVKEIPKEASKIEIMKL